MNKLCVDFIKKNLDRTLEYGDLRAFLKKHDLDSMTYYRTKQLLENPSRLKKRGRKLALQTEIKTLLKNGFSVKKVAKVLNVTQQRVNYYKDKK